VLPVKAAEGIDAIMASFIQHRIGFCCIPSVDKLEQLSPGGEASPALPGIQ